MNKNTRILAYYLPQFHPVKENNEWWGPGFTEWTNVAKAKKYYPGHYQPRIPADLGFYDLRVAETREEQALLAKEAGVDGFAYWHYWFGKGKELLERPFDEVVNSGRPDFPFCLAWANESWYNKSWDKNGNDKLLIEQTYGGVDDYTAHFYRVLPAFKDKRYIRQDGMPIFIIYKPLASPEIISFMDIWQKLAIKEGLKGIFFIAHANAGRYQVPEDFKLGFKLVNTVTIGIGTEKNIILKFIKKYFRAIIRRIFHLPLVYSYKKASKNFFDDEIDSQENVCPSIITGWDHTPRSGDKGMVLSHETPELFYNHAKYVLEHNNSPFIFVKSWNEWAEGNYIEPDLRYGKEYLMALKKAIKDILQR